MATVANVLTYTRAQAQTDSNGLTDANGIVFANEALLDFHRKLITRGVDASQLQEAYRSATVNTGTYLYPTDMFFLKAMELNYADTTGQNYKVASQVDVSNLPAGVGFGWLRSNASTTSPYFDDHGDWYEIFPTPTSAHNISQLIRLFYYLEPTEFAATTDTITYPASLDYRILGLRIAANYLYSKESFDAADRFDEKYNARVDELIGTLARGSQQPIQSTTLQMTGFEF